MKIKTIRQKNKKPLFFFVLAFLVIVAAIIIIVAVRHNSAAVKVATVIKTVPAATSQTSKPVVAAAPAPINHCVSNSTSKLLLVSISQQHLWACEGSTQVNDSAVTTGTTAVINGVDDATPTGTWTIYSKQTDRHLRGTDANGSWDDYVQYWMPFNGSYGFHDASWQTFPFGSPDYQTNGSHGCVHLPTAFAGWVYGWAPIGTTVTIET